MLKRKYFRKCGICGERHEQREMIREPFGWLCIACMLMVHPEYEED